MSSLPRINCQFRPTILHGHNKPLTTVKYNLDGDLLFTAGKDRRANVFYADTGNRLGTYGFHKGAVWDVDPSWDSSYVVTACADAYARLFRTTTGEILARMPHNGAVRGVKWADGNGVFATASDPLHAQRERSVVSVFEVPDDILQGSGVDRDEDAPILTPKIEMQMDLGDKAVCIDWTYGDEYIIVGTDSGLLIKLDPSTGKEVMRKQIHTARINRISFNNDKTLFVTASKDQEAKLIDPATFDVVKAYKTDRPVNGAVISPTHPHIIMGGGMLFDSHMVYCLTACSDRSGSHECDNNVVIVR
jgi:translation initiation factor 3 subunit I